MFFSATVYKKDDYLYTGGVRHLIVALMCRAAVFQYSRVAWRRVERVAIVSWGGNSRSFCEHFRCPLVAVCTHFCSRALHGSGHTLLTPVRGGLQTGHFARRSRLGRCSVVTRAFKAPSRSWHVASDLRGTALIPICPSSQQFLITRSDLLLWVEHLVKLCVFVFQGIIVLVNSYLCGKRFM